MNRRGFLAGALGFLAAPAIVRASSLMPVVAQPLMVELKPLIIVSSEQSGWFVTPMTSDALSWALYGDDVVVGKSVKAAFAS